MRAYWITWIYFSCTGPYRPVCTNQILFKVSLALRRLVKLRLKPNSYLIVKRYDAIIIQSLTISFSLQESHSYDCPCPIHMRHCRRIQVTELFEATVSLFLLHFMLLLFVDKHVFNINVLCFPIVSFNLTNIIMAKVCEVCYSFT